MDALVFGGKDRSLGDGEVKDRVEVIVTELGVLEDESIFAWLEFCCDLPGVVGDWLGLHREAVLR